MIVIALWVPYLATKGIGMGEFMELQAVFALVILCGEVPSGLLSDLWGRRKTLLLGSTAGGSCPSGWHSESCSRSPSSFLFLPLVLREML